MARKRQKKKDTGTPEGHILAGITEEGVSTRPRAREVCMQALIQSLGYSVESWILSKGFI